MKRYLEAYIGVLGHDLERGSLRSHPEGRIFTEACESDFEGVGLLEIQSIIFNMKNASSSSSRVTRILRRIASKGPDWAFTTHDFADFGSPRSTGIGAGSPQALRKSYQMFSINS